MTPEALIATLAMAIIVVITVANVLVRYFTNGSFAWTEEISVYLMVVVTLAGSAFAAMQDRHVRLSAVVESGPPARRQRLAFLSAATATTLYIVLTVLLVRLGYEEFIYGETSVALGLPRWWYTTTLVALCATVAARTAVWGLRRARGDESTTGPSA
ncbi:MAG: TRAP transporter small permease [Ideonella sp.]|nr:TRAP transporter small permease [Ideonella sp.]MCC7458977.1 TRAP transporter small permease [Nitrospira sp.]